MAPAAAEVRVERQGCLGILTLDRPAALNALTHAMVVAMSEALARWADDPGVGAVVMRSVPGRAFCAGGDIRAVREALESEGLPAIRPFFWDEYRLNWRIKRFPKPYVALIDGVTMGGGVGISVHGSHRLATSRTLFAMPETAIGMFPDVGTTYALPRVAGRDLPLGLYLGLSGERLGPGDCLGLGLATHFVPETSLDDLAGELAKLRPEAARAPSGVDGVLRQIRDDAVEPPAASLTPTALATIRRCFARGTLDGCLEALRAEPGEWAAMRLAALERASPLALRLTFALLREGARSSFEDCLRREYRAVQRVLEHGDFREGVRALIVDKDRRPRWRVASVAEVTEAETEACYAPLPSAADELDFDWRQG